ncbi:MAG TPA: copper amine oxidase N-terminal domain-containing protein, partial [Candidatus Cryosericum sp.]
MRKFNRIVATVLAMLMLALTVVIAPAVVRAESVPDDVYTVPGDVYGVPGSKTMVIIMIIGSNTIKIDGVEGKKDAGPQIKWGRTFVPLAPIIEALGGTIEWNAKTHTVTIVLGTQTLVLTMGNAYAVANGKRFRIDSNPDVAPYIQAPGRTMLP